MANCPVIRYFWWSRACSRSNSTWSTSRDARDRRWWWVHWTKDPVNVCFLREHWNPRRCAVDYWRDLNFEENANAVNDRSLFPTDWNLSLRFLFYRIISVDDETTEGVRETCDRRMNVPMIRRECAENFYSGQGEWRTSMCWLAIHWTRAEFQSENSGRFPVKKAMWVSGSGERISSHSNGVEAVMDRETTHGLLQIV